MFRACVAAVWLTLSASLAAVAASPTITPLQQAVAQAAADDPEIVAFYRARDFAPIWFGDGAASRRAALLEAFAAADDHGLPTDRYDATAIRDDFRAVRATADLGALDVEMTRRLLAYARDVSSGILEPRQVDPTLVLDVPRPETAAVLDAFTGGDPRQALRDLVPDAPTYVRLQREKMRLGQARRAGGWGPAVPQAKLQAGDRGPAVVALRDRLIRMGYLPRTLSPDFDGALDAAVRRFQADHGLRVDGVAGGGTIAAINVPVEARLAQVLVGLERQRWMNRTLEDRHILVNLAEQRAYVFDDGKVTFDTVVVIGKAAMDRRTPEFSHEMTHMVVNPSWYVPRSIAVEEYLPALRRGGARHLEVYSRRGRVNPDTVDFTRYTADTFPFSLRQPPGPRNALGKVKFMFPNRWNIYLHDTPAKSLFDETVRTFSHGCVRVGRPFDLARHLLAAQEVDPRGTFQAALDSGRERQIDLVEPVGVHLVYWSAWVDEAGRAHYRGDPYGRDAAVRRALAAAGVELAAGRS